MTHANYCFGDTVVAKNLLGKRVCGNCKYSFVKDAYDGPMLYCSNEDFLSDPHVVWKSHVVPEKRTCKYWEEQ